MKSIIFSWQIIFQRPNYLIAVFAIFLFLIIIQALVIKWSIVVFIFTFSDFDWPVRLSIIFKLLFHFPSALILIDKIIVLLIASLAAINITMTIYYFKKRFLLGVASGASVLAIIFSVIGFGCLSCSAVFFSTLISISSVAVFINFLPWGSWFFGIVSVVLLLWSIYGISKKIQQPTECKIPHYSINK